MARKLVFTKKNWKISEVEAHALTCGKSSSPGCTSLPKPSRRAQWFLLAGAIPNARLTLHAVAPIPYDYSWKKSTTIVLCDPCDWQTSGQNLKYSFNFLSLCLQKAYSNWNLKPKLILHPEPTLLDVVIGQSASILELLASKDESLLVRGNSCKQERNQHHQLSKSKIKRDKNKSRNKITATAIHKHGSVHFRNLIYTVTRRTKRPRPSI